ncbi:MAG: efflux RND transporter periplasmic adaptor subunit [Variibacter sp.]
MLDKSGEPEVKTNAERAPTRPGRSWRSRFFSFLIGCVVIAAVVLWIEGPWQPQPRQGGGRFRMAEGPVPVLAQTVAVADVPVYLDGVGTTKALNTVTVRPQVDGKLIKVSFKEGQDVVQGYVLAEIDPTTYQAQLDQAVAKKAQDEAQLANARIDLDRYTRLAASNAGSKQQADAQRAQVAQLEAQVKLDQAAIDNAKAILGYTKIVAPLAGRTGIRQVDEGNIVHASDATGIVVITQLKPISIFFSLPQQQLSRVNKAFAQGPLKVEALGSDNKTVVDTGTLQVIDNQVDQTTGTVKMRAEFPNPNLQLWPGQFINVRLLVETLQQVMTVPTAAVQRGPNGTFVYVVKDDNTVTMHQVAVTQQDDTRAVLASGVAKGERVVTSGFVRLREGSGVTVSTGDGPQPPPAAAPTPRRREGAPGEGGERRRGQGRRQREGGGSGTSQ